MVHHHSPQPGTGQPGTGQPSISQPSTGQPGTGQPSTDVLQASRGRRKQKLLLTVAVLDAAGIVLIVLGLTVLDSMALFWVGLAIVLFAAIYLIAAYVRISRSGDSAHRHITPPGGPR